LLAVSLLLASSGTLGATSEQKWFLLEPPADETSDRVKVLDQVPLAQWKRVGVYQREAACESRQREAARAAMEEYVRLSTSAPLPSMDVWLAVARDRRQAEASRCVASDDPRLTPASPR
jgi:hypothetical protein